MSINNDSGLLTETVEQRPSKIVDFIDTKQSINQKNEIKLTDYAVGMGPFADYFIKNIKKISSLKQIQDKYGNTINFKLITQIANGNTSVNKHKRQFSIKSKIEQTYEKVQLEKKQLIKQKQYTIEKLNDIMKAEAQLTKKNASIIKSQSPKHATSIQRRLNQHQESVQVHSYSHHHEEKQSNLELKKALKKLRQFQQLMKKKEIEVKQFVEHLNEEDKKEYLATIQEERKKHRQQQQKRKQQVHKLKEKQQESKKKSKEFIQQIRPDRYKFQIVQQMQEIQNQQKQKLLEQWKHKNNANIFQEIKEHEQKYLSTLNERKQTWVNNFQENIRNHQRRKRYHSIFTERILEEDQKKYEEELQKQEKKNNFLDKIKSYAHHVSENHKPTIEKSMEHEKDENSKKLRHSFSRIQVRTLGLQYLKEILQKNKKKSSIEKIKEKDDNKEQMNLKSKSGSSSLPAIKQNVPYRDYLKEMPKRNKLSANPETFKTILNERKEGWAETAFSILNKLQKQPKKQKKPLQSAYHKIQLLNAIL